MAYQSRLGITRHTREVTRLASPSTSVELTGVPALVNALAQFSAAVAKKHVRGALQKSGRLFAGHAKSRAPVETGALKKSIGMRVYTSREGNLGCVIGPRKDARKAEVKKYTYATVKNKKGKTKLASKAQRASAKDFRIPANYAHLVEFGHRKAQGGTLAPIQKEGWTGEKIWSRRLRTMIFKYGAPRRAGKSKRTGVHGGGRSIGNVAAKPFMRPAFDGGQSGAASAIRNHLADAIVKEAARARAKARAG